MNAQLEQRLKQVIYRLPNGLVWWEYWYDPLVVTVDPPPPPCLPPGVIMSVEITPEPDPR